uniref:Uncharacterized protein n=1 Tax=Molossus molossus TaxID=27622 RepID=A0A7J8DTN2_MOLMO|nr:hypothetical protein HJG59_009183 [Molossus molossus]
MCQSWRVIPPVKDEGTGRLRAVPRPDICGGRGEEDWVGRASGCSAGQGGVQQRSPHAKGIVSCLQSLAGASPGERPLSPAPALCACAGLGVRGTARVWVTPGTAESLELSACQNPHSPSICTMLLLFTLLQRRCQYPS